MRHPETIKTETLAVDDKAKPLQRHRKIADDNRTRKYEITGAAEQGFVEVPIKRSGKK